VGLPYTLADPLRTARLTIRPVAAADVDGMHAYQSDPAVCRYLPYEPRSRAEMAAKVAQWSAARTLAGDGDYWILAVERTATPGVIGDLYFALQSAANAGGVIGWVLHPAHQGHGYMTEAASALLDVAFTDLALHRVRAVLDPRNTASAALCRRLGMRQEAHFVEDLWFKGAWSDTVVYALLAREWRRPSAPAPGGALGPAVTP
jgi:RimJ/RimL family protein N-acetyltransferase